jgi:hypothetical protein
MTFGSTFGRTFSPTFQPKSQAAGGYTTWWTLDGAITSCLSAFQPKGAASYAASLLDLSGNGYDAVEGVSRDPSKWDSTNGWQCYSNANNTTLQTSHKGATGMTGIARFSNASGSYVFGIGDRWEVDPSGTGITYRNNSAVTISPALTSGIVALTNSKGYRNGALDTDGIGNRTDLGSYYIGIGSRDGYSFNFLGYIQAIAFYSTTLTPTQIADLTTAMAAL